MEMTLASSQVAALTAKSAGARATPIPAQLSSVLAAFELITFAELAQAELMDRSELKYVFSQALVLPLLAVGSAGMAQAPDESSSQSSVLANFSTAGAAGTLLHLQSASGEDLLTFAPAKAYQSIAFSSPLLEEGLTYVLYGGGRAAETDVNGLYASGAYTPGQELGTFTLCGITTYLGSRSP